METEIAYRAPSVLYVRAPILDAPLDRTATSHRKCGSHVLVTSKCQALRSGPSSEALLIQPRGAVTLPLNSVEDVGGPERRPTASYDGPQYSLDGPGWRCVR